MVLLWILLSFLLACAAGWLCLFGDARAAAAERLGALARWLARRWRQPSLRGADAFAAGWCGLRGGAGRVAAQLLRHRWAALAGLPLILAPPLCAWLLSGRDMLDGYGNDARVANLFVTDLLKGEQLAPPSPLPPLAFSTREVTLIRPLLGGASRNWQLLDHDFGQRLLLVFKIMKETHGVEMALLEGYRSPERQNMLAAAGPAVTHAKAFQSYHQYGLAADCAFLRDGKLLISEKDPWAMLAYRHYGEVAESLGLRWGGRWTMMDFGHVELGVPGALKADISAK